MYEAFIFKSKDFPEGVLSWNKNEQPKVGFTEQEWEKDIIELTTVPFIEQFSELMNNTIKYIKQVSDNSIDKNTKKGLNFCEEALLKNFTVLSMEFLNDEPVAFVVKDEMGDVDDTIQTYSLQWESIEEGIPLFNKINELKLIEFFAVHIWTSAMDECKSKSKNPSLSNELFIGCTILREYSKVISHLNEETNDLQEQSHLNLSFN